MGRPKAKKVYAAIHITRQQCWGDDRQPYEQVLGKFYGAQSSTELSYREKLDLIDRMKAIRDGDPQPPVRRGPRGLWASEAQVGKIGVLESLLGWDNRKRMTGFIRRQTAKNKTRWMLTGREASKVIVGLQRILAGNKKKVYQWLNTASAEELKGCGKQKIQQLNKS